MAQYPRSQTGMVVLVEDMIAGFESHPDFFPHADTVSLQQAHDEFMAASNALITAEVTAGAAAKVKLEKQRQLETAMKNNIRHATADCSPNPDRLCLIGWGPRHEPVPIDAPASPGSLKVIAQHEGTVFLKWKKSPRRLGGFVRMYIIERRSLQAGTGYTDWELATNSYNPEAILKNQPTSVKMEYRVKASNAGGESCSTNVASVVL